MTHHDGLADDSEAAELTARNERHVRPVELAQQIPHAGVRAREAQTEGVDALDRIGFDDQVRFLAGWVIVESLVGGMVCYVSDWDAGA